MNSIPDNVWAFLLFVIAAGLALYASISHDKDLMQFALSVAVTGAALFQRRESKSA